MMLAKSVSVPFGFLYLNEPPDESLPIPEFRTVGGRRTRMDANIRDLLQDIQFKREWFDEHREKTGAEELRYVGSFSNNFDISEIAKDIRLNFTNVAPDLFDGFIQWESFLKKMMAAAEEIGIWVIRSGIVGNNTKRSLSVAAFRGFAIADKRLPIIFLNGQDATAAQIFTFAHELAHIWIGSTDINSVDLGEDDFGSRHASETICNRVAAEFLIPADSFQGAWTPDVGIDYQVSTLSRKFSVSKIVVARRAYDPPSN